jgi:1,4-dihydroxy-2-naphthoate polyprenyltransferase
MNAHDAVQPAPGGGVWRMISVYARLGNVKVYFQWIPVVVGWSLVAHPFGLSGAQVVALLLFIVATIAMGCSAGTLDDVQGFRDGLDQRTYAGDDTLRPTSGKPLVLGEISEQGAYRFAMAIGVVGACLGVAAAIVSPHHPLWLIALVLFTAYASTQYSYGTRLSYHGAGELLLGYLMAAVLLMPVIALEGGVSATGWFQAYLVGAMQSQVTIFSSSYDADDDRAARRMTPAARLTPKANRRFIAAVFLVTWMITAVGFATGALDRWLLVALLPMWALQVGQLVRGVGQARWLDARFLGWRAFDAGVVALVVVNLLAH